MVSRITPDVVSIKLARPAGYSFHTGQYVVVRITTADRKSIVRQYSFSSGENDHLLEILIQQEPEGMASSWFFTMAKVGMTIEISQAFGSFTPKNDRKKHLVCIAGRIGIAPFLSMILSGYRMNLLYSVREKNQVCYPELIQSVGGNVFVSSTGKYITKERLRLVVEPNNVYYICGSKQYVDDMMEMLLDIGVEASDVRRELFTLT